MIRCVIFKDGVSVQTYEGILPFPSRDGYVIIPVDVLPEGPQYLTGSGSEFSPVPTQPSLYYNFKNKAWSFDAEKARTFLKDRAGARFDFLCKQPITIRGSEINGDQVALDNIAMSLQNQNPTLLWRLYNDTARIFENKMEFTDFLKEAEQKIIQRRELLYFDKWSKTDALRTMSDAELEESIKRYDPSA